MASIRRTGDAGSGTALGHVKDCHAVSSNRILVLCPSRPFQPVRQLLFYCYFGPLLLFSRHFAWLSFPSLTMLAITANSDST